MRPREVRRIDAEARLQILWDDGHQSSLAYDHLRRNCRCSRCRAAAQQGASAPVLAGITVAEISEFGGYALRFHFSDGHDTGIYPWEYLLELAAP